MSDHTSNSNTSNNDPDGGHPPGQTVFFGALATTLLTASIMIALQGYLDQIKRAEERDKILNTEYVGTDQYLENDRRTLESFDWIDADRGVVRVPIERGIQDYLDECAKRGR